MSSILNEPAPRSNLSDIEITKILTLHHDGHSIQDIAKIIDRSKDAVQHALETYTLDTFVGHNTQYSQPRKTTKCEDRYILHASKQFNEVFLCDIPKIVNIPVSQSIGLGTGQSPT